jgi:hypothetical protein
MTNNDLLSNRFNRTKISGRVASNRAIVAGSERDPWSLLPEPEIVIREAREVRSKLRVVVFNAREGRHLSGILECLSRPPLVGADVIFLCDVEPSPKMSRYAENSYKIATALKMSFAYVPKWRINLSSGMPLSLGGNAILSSTFHIFRDWPASKAAIVSKWCCGHSRSYLSCTVT